ncbi:hypothetical protein [Devosia sp.]|uniref:hypothetical protein n=1 Tax=Devosia sp. TaxID=1871048 RepID=UPI003BAAFCFF
MRSTLISLALVGLLATGFAGSALAGEAYAPIKLEAAKSIQPSPELIADATALLANVKKGDGDAIGLGLASKVTTIDGSIDMAFPRNKVVIGPYKTTEDMLVALSGTIGGDVPTAPDGSDDPKLHIAAEREFIVQSLTDSQPWGADPMVKGAVCTYAYRSFDAKALQKLADKLGIQSSGFVYVTAPYELKKTPADSAAAAGTLAPDLLYALDYKTDAPRNWIAVHLPEGGTAFARMSVAKFDKPYATGLCFNKNKAGKWVVVAQVATSL